MKKNKNIPEELIEIAPTLAGMQNEPTYTFPNNYFLGFAAGVLLQLKAGAEPNYYFSKAMPLTLPANYFHDLPGIILHKIQSETTGINPLNELENISPLLNSISKKNPYTLPAGYFENLQPTPNHLPAVETTLIIKARFSTFYRLAVAAVITAILAVGLFIVLGKNNNPLQAGTNKTEIKNLTEDDISEFLSANANSEDAATTIISSSAVAPEIHDAVKEITDDEIKQFLQDNELPEGI